MYMPAKSNDINWCMGMTTNVVHCTTAVVMGVAMESSPLRGRIIDSRIASA